MSGLLDWIDSATDYASDKFDAVMVEWRDAVDSFSAALDTHSANRDKAYAVGEGEEWEALYNRTQGVIDSVKSIQDTVSGGFNYVKGAIGLGGMGPRFR